MWVLRSSCWTEMTSHAINGVEERNYTYLLLLDFLALTLSQLVSSINMLNLPQHILLLTSLQEETQSHCPPGRLPRGELAQDQDAEPGLWVHHLPRLPTEAVCCLRGVHQRHLPHHPSDQSELWKVPHSRWDGRDDHQVGIDNAAVVVSFDVCSLPPMQGVFSDVFHPLCGLQYAQSLSSWPAEVVLQLQRKCSPGKKSRDSTCSVSCSQGIAGEQPSLKSHP